MPAVHVGSIGLSFDGGAGNDTIAETFRKVTTVGFVNVDIQGGTGNDTVMAIFDKVNVNAGLDLNISGGVGDDLLLIFAGGQGDDIFEVQLTMEIANRTNPTEPQHTNNYYHTHVSRLHEITILN